MQLYEQLLAASYIFSNVIKTYYEFPAIWKPNSDMSFTNYIYNTTDWREVFGFYGHTYKVPKSATVYANIAYVELYNTVVS